MRLPSLLVFLLALTACTGLPRLVDRFEDENEERERFDAPDLAEEYYRMKRGVPEGLDPQKLYAAARKQMETMPKAIGSWSFLGPGNIGGRTRGLIVDPTNPNVLWAGAVSGGVWKTTDGGARWEPVGDLLANLAVNSLAMHPQNTNIVYAGTGEGYFREEIRGTAMPLRGNGIFVTRDGGHSWRQLPATAGPDFHWVNDLAISTHDPRRIYAATRTGVWRSLDEGETWTRVRPVTVRGGCLDLAFRTDTDGDYLFASCGVLEQATVYRHRNAENDQPWEAVLSEPLMSRTSLAIAPSNPSIVYALAASNQPGSYNQGLLAVFRSDANGDPGTWQARIRNTDSDRLGTLLLTNPIAASTCEGNNPGYSTLGWHSNVIAVDPVDPDKVWAAGIDLFRSDDGGRSWGVGSYWWISDNQRQFVHADQHAIVFHPQYDGASNQTMWAANDGGVFRTDNARAAVRKGDQAPCAPLSDVSWQTLNHNYGATQFYNGAVWPDGRRWLGGAQDNGTVVGTLELGIDRWEMIWGGDGGYVAVDPVDPRYVYAESQGARLVRSTNGGATFQSIAANLTGSFLFIAPFLIDPNQHTRLWVGGRRMYRSENQGTAWALASPLFTGSVSAIAVAPGRPDRVLAGTNAGEIARNNQATTTDDRIEWPIAIPRAGFVSSLTFDPTNADIAYATYAGFGGQHVWKSTDGGVTWSPIDNGVPDIPVHSMAIDPTNPAHIYLGTDLGIFVTNDAGGSWAVENTGFAAAVTETVLIAPGANGPAVYAFTHGRGAWRAELTAGTRRRVIGH